MNSLHHGVRDMWLQNLEFHAIYIEFIKDKYHQEIDRAPYTHTILEYCNLQKKDILILCTLKF